MFHFHLIRNLKTTLWLLLVALIPLAIGGLYWANKTGLPEDWREALEQEISKFGVHVEIGSLTYVPLRGFVAKNVQVFAEEGRVHEISRFERVQISFDNTDLAMGHFRPKKIILNNARLSLPVDPKNPGGNSLDFTGLYGTIYMPGERLIEVRDARGQVGGIDVTLSARVLGKDKTKKKPYDEKKDGKRREMIAHVINELEHWNFDPENRPHVQIDLEGDIIDKGSLKADFRVQAPILEKKQYRLKNFAARGFLNGYLLTVDSFSGEDGRGVFGGYADYDVLDRDGRFDIESSIDLPRLLKSWLATPLNMDVLVGGKQKISAAGDFRINEQDVPEVYLTGHALCGSVMFRGVSFDSLETWFSWQNGALFLKDLALTRPDGKANAKILWQDGVIRMTLDSTMPAPLFKPFFLGQTLEHVIADFSENTNALTDIHLDGSIDTTRPSAWEFKGNGLVKNMSYRGVPVKSAYCSFLLNHDELDFFDGEVVFDYSNYTLKKNYGGPATGKAKVGRIRYNHPAEAVEVEGVTGKFWVSPMLRMFAPSIADNLEQYRFHTPPLLNGSGLIDVTPSGKTRMDVVFSSPGKADYKFLGEDITLSEPRAKVAIRGSTVKVTELSAVAFNGPVAGNFTNTSKSGLSGELHWSKLSVKGLSSTYGFDMKGAGQLTGRIEFVLPNSNIETMSGQGLIALENAELLSVPIFGPLSPVMSKVLNNKRAGFERAKSAFCTFTIHKGILRTRDFQTETNSITFAGDGKVDMKDQTIDFTIRLNARGFLGLITLPLRPFYGLFQFRGTGPLKKTVWENVHFTSPPEDQNRILLAPPPKAQVIDESR